MSTVMPVLPYQIDGAQDAFVMVCVAEATPVWTIYEAVREGAGQVPGIWTETQVNGWRAVTRAVHDKGALICCQLLHAGRVAQPGIADHPIVRGTDAPLPPVSSWFLIPHPLSVTSRSRWRSVT